jgi:KaiC/GvpD/RAD55 family RecA-like ATPase
MLKLPSAIYAERYLLGVVIRDGLDIKDLSPADFFEPIHQEIAFCIKQINDQGNHPDELVVLNSLRANNSMVQAHYINELTSEVKESRLNQAWSDEIKRTAALRAIAINAEHVQRLASDPNADPESLIAYNEGTLKSLIKREKKSGPVLMNIEAMKTFERKEDPNTVIGNRWLCKGGSLLLVSQSGVGKSSFALQFLVSLCINRQFFGIKAKRPLRVVMLQAENDLGDVAEAYQDITAGMNLFASEQQTLDENLFIYRDTNSVGEKFLEQMRSLIELHRADVILVDPLLSFAGIEVADQKQMTEFLRHGVARILEDTGCILVAVHHTTKPKSAKDKEGQTPSDLAYSGAGASELVNYVREVGVLVRQPGEEPVFKFSLTKRRGRAGMLNANGDFAGDIIVRHARQAGQIRWEYGELSAPAPEPTLKVEARHSDSKHAKGSPSRFNH